MIALVTFEGKTLKELKPEAASVSDAMHDAGWSVKPGIFAQANAKMSDGSSRISMQFQKDE